MQNFNYKQQHSSWKKNSYLSYQNDLWKKKRRKKILLTKKPHVFGLSIFNIYCNKQIISKEKKKHDQHWLGYLFPSVQLTFDSDYWCGIVVSSNKHDDLIFIYAFLLKSHLFLLLFIFQSFRIIAKQSFSMQKCTLTRLFGFRRKPACLFMEYAGTMQIQVAAHTSCRTRLNTDISLTYTIFNTDDVSSFVRFVDFCHKTTSVML